MSEENADVADNYNKSDQGMVLGAFDGDLNDTSAVLWMAYGETTALLTGDLDSRQEQALTSLGVIRPVDVLKVAHHRSKYSSIIDFLRLLRPE